MADAVQALEQILLDRGQLPAGADQVFGRAREVGDRTLDRVQLAGAGGQAPVRGGVPEPPGPGVQLGGGPVQRFLRPGEPGARPGPLPLRAGDLAERLGHRRGLGQLLLRAAQIRQQVQHPLPLGGQVLPLAAQVRDQPVEFGEPGAAPAGPGGRPDVLRRGLGPGAQLQPVAVLRPGRHHGGTARTGPGRLPRTGRPVPPVHFVRNENRPQYCLHHGRRDQVLIFGDEHVGQGPPGGPRLGRDGQQVPVGLGRRDRGRGQRGVGMDPGGQHARPVQRAFYPGGVLVREPVGEPDQLPERRAGTSRAVGGPQVGGGRGVVVLAGDLVPFRGPGLLLAGELGFARW